MHGSSGLPPPLAAHLPSMQTRVSAHPSSSWQAPPAGLGSAHVPGQEESTESGRSHQPLTHTSSMSQAALSASVPTKTALQTASCFLEVSIAQVDAIAATHLPAASGLYLILPVLTAAVRSSKGPSTPDPDKNALQPAVDENEKNAPPQFAIAVQYALAKASCSCSIATGLLGPVSVVEASATVHQPTLHRRHLQHPQPYRLVLRCPWCR